MVLHLQNSGIEKMPLEHEVHIGQKDIPVDIAREVIGKDMLRGVPVPKRLYHLTVSAWIINSQGQYLLS